LSLLFERGVVVRLKGRLEVMNEVAERWVSLDPRIRTWVLLPISIATFVMGILRMYLSRWLMREPRVVLHRVRDAGLIARWMAIQRDGGILPEEQLAMRRHWFVKEDGGVFREERNPRSAHMMLMDPEMLSQKTIELICSAVPQMLFGAWVRFFFGGFAVCRLPFGPPQRFRAMLQSGIEIAGRDLDVAYVSALSWYIINLFGNQCLFMLFMSHEATEEPRGPPNDLNQTMMKLYSMYGADPKTLFEAGIKYFNEDIKHEWSLPSAEAELLTMEYYDLMQRR